jgi:death on curing protein
MRYLTVGEVIELHRLIIAATGGAAGVRDLGALQSAVAQPRMSYGGADLYHGLAEKSAALCFSLVMGHPFVDGNKRVAHAAMETFLVLNGFELNAPVEVQEELFLSLAGGTVSRGELVAWIKAHVTKGS